MSNSIDLWSKIAAPLPKDAIQWRVDGRPVQRGGDRFARFVAYVDSRFVRQRLDEVVPGEWDLKLHALPPTDGPEPFHYQATLQILGVVREDVGAGKDWKSAASDAFKRAATRYGVAEELYSYENLYVKVDAQGKPLEDPAEAYARKYERSGLGVEEAPEVPAAPARKPVQAVTCGACGTSYDANRCSSCPACADNAGKTTEPPRAKAASGGGEEVACPKCGGKMWDNRASKRNPKAPDFKCRDKTCDGVIWPPREGRPTASLHSPGPLVPEGEASFEDVKRIFDAEEAEQDAAPF